MRNEFVEYYSESVKEQLDSRKALEEVETDLRLSVLKPLHAQWLVNLYSYFTSPDGVKVISCGWKKAEITGLLDGKQFYHQRTHSTHYLKTIIRSIIINYCD